MHECNSCTKCVGSPVIIHSRTPNCHPVFPEHGCDHRSITSQINVVLIPKLLVSLICLGYFSNMLSMAVYTTRHWFPIQRIMRSHYTTHWLTSSTVLDLKRMVTLTDLFIPASQHNLANTDVSNAVTFL